MLLKICAALFLMLGLASPAQSSALQKMFESLGGESNISGPGGFQDQAHGYYTGGSIVMRQKNKAVSPFNISLPHLGMGCGGIDMYFGSISAIKGEEMVQLLRSMAANVPTYAFQLALKTMAPQLENLMSQIRKVVQDINNMMLDSCQMSQNIVGGLFPTGTAASEIICQDAVRGGGEDWFGARKHCQKDGAAENKTAEARKKFPDLLQGEYNLTWHVLQKMPQYRDDKDFCHFIMTTVGTLISRKEPDGRFKVHTLQGKGDQKAYLATFLKGGQAIRYSCDEESQCLNPKLGFISITEEGNSKIEELQRRINTTSWEDTYKWGESVGLSKSDIHKIDDGIPFRTMKIYSGQSMKGRASSMIRNLFSKYVQDVRITDSELSFLNDSVNLPVYRYIQIAAASGTPFIMEDTSEYIAVSILLTQFDKISTEIIEALDNLQSVQLESGTIEGFKKNIQDMRGHIQDLLSSADGQALWRLTQVIQGYEQALAAKH